MLCERLLFFIIIARVCSLCDSGGPYYYLPYYDFVPIQTFYNASANTSVCATFAYKEDSLYLESASFGARECHSIGEVVLVGRYIHLGFHNQGSLGTQICTYFPFTAIPSQLGLLVDNDKNGFNSENASVPGYVGDLAVSPYPVEGTK